VPALCISLLLCKNLFGFQCLGVCSINFLPRTPYAITFGIRLDSFAFCAYALSGFPTSSFNVLPFSSYFCSTQLNLLM
jgi:hypothetical protein